VNSLAQVLLKLTCPGVPDLYQGCELWDFSLVDPDNRRPVDYRRRRDVLAELRERIDWVGQDLTPLTRELLAGMHDGKIKAYLICRTLNFRRTRERLFARGDYQPLEATGAKRDHVCAFARAIGEEVVIVLVPRLVVRLTDKTGELPLGPGVWEDTGLLLTPSLAGRSYRNLFTGEVIDANGNGGATGLSLARVLNQFPVALREGCEPRPPRDAAHSQHSESSPG